MMNRRTFIQSGAKALITVPVIFNKSFSLFSDSSAAQIISIFDPLATSLQMRPGQSANSDGVIVDKILSYSVNRMRVFHMVDTAVKKLTGKSTVGEAWESLFPAGHPTPNTTISIKLNLSYGEQENENDWSKTHCPFGPKTALSDAIVWGLTQMLDGTFPIENILLFDCAYSSGLRRKFPLIQGYRPVFLDSEGLQKDRPKGSYGIHWVTPRHPREILPDAPGFIAAPDFPLEYRAPQKMLTPVYQNDFMINVAIAKTHREAGITGVMKNTFGCTDNPVGTHGTTWQRDDSPYPGSRLCAPAFYKAIDQQSPCILNVLDALNGIYQGGPLSGKVFQENTITVSKNPVAIDTYLLHLINKHRRKNNLAPLSAENGKNADGFPNASILRVASEMYDMGSMSMEKSYHYDLSGTPEQYVIPSLQKSQARVGDVYKNKSRYSLDLSLDHSRRKHRIESRIEDMDGNIIKMNRTASTRSSKASIHWNHRNEKGEILDKGLYVWHVVIDDTLHSRIIKDI